MANKGSQMRLKPIGKNFGNYFVLCVANTNRPKISQDKRNSEFGY